MRVRMLIAFLLLGAACSDPSGPSIETLGFTSPSAPLRLTAPGFVRLGVLTRFADGADGDLSGMTLATTGPLEAEWELGPVGWRAVRLIASAPGTGTVTIGYGDRTASIEVTAEELKLKSISTSTGYSCGLALDDTAWCWGGNYDGALGVNTLGKCSGSACQYGGNDGNPTPLPVAGNRQYVQIVTAGYLCPTTFTAGVCGRTCAVTAAGEAWCWGHGSSTAVRVAQNLTIASLTMKPGVYNSLTPAESCGLTTGGKAYCFTESAATPVAGGMTFQAFQAGAEHSCGISGGDVYCWGSNEHANLGIGSADTDAHPDPVKVPSAAKFTAVGVGPRSTCALDTTGAVQCWGYVGSIHTQVLCDGSDPKCIMSPQPMPGGRAYTAIAQSDAAPALCALTNDGQVDCWDDFTKAPHTLDAPEAIRAITASCGVSVTNTLYCWDSSFVVTKFP